MMCCLFFHKWDKWQDFKKEVETVTNYTYPFTVVYTSKEQKEFQMKKCLKCNLKKIKKIK